MAGTGAISSSDIGRELVRTDDVTTTGRISRGEAGEVTPIAIGSFQCASVVV